LGDEETIYFSRPVFPIAHHFVAFLQYLDIGYMNLIVHSIVKNRFPTRIFIKTDFFCAIIASCPSLCTVNFFFGSAAKKFFVRNNLLKISFVVIQNSLFFPDLFACLLELVLVKKMTCSC